MKKLLYIVMFLLAASATEALAQVDKAEVRQGNRYYEDGEYEKADIEYRKALQKDSLSLAANYNMASTLYRLKNYSDALEIMEEINGIAAESEYASDYYFNLADMAIACKEYQTAKEALEKYLLKNPADVAAKENYAYVKKKLEQQQQQQQQDQNKDQNDQNQNDDQNKDQNQDQNQNQDQDQNQNEDQNKDQDGDQNKDRQDQNEDQDSQNGQNQNPKMSQKEAQKVLQMVQAKESETQEKVNKEKAMVLAGRQKEKNW